MILAAAVVASVAANAAAVEWGAGTITRFDDSTANKNVTGYLFAIAAADYTSYAAMDATTLSKTIYADYKDSLSSAVATGTATKKGALTLTGIDATAGTPVYAAILYVDGVNSDYVMGNVATVTWSGVGFPGIDNLSVTKLGEGSGAGATAWATAAVPEPTSGLLLLLGIAGLALKRKRA